jgi:hypothetical protein
MLNYKYLNNNNKIKKKVINLFIPMLFGFKNNKLTKTFYYENMYYKVFYLIFNHISLIKVFFTDKKIFYNFSRYFQTNLYIFLIKKKLMILNLFFHFFYSLFLTFENLEDIYTNQLLFRGYKHRFKYKTFFKKWIKPDHGVKFYFKQRINSISSYVLNFSIYRNFYFSKYNLFLIHTKLIYKLFYYFKMLQYKLQSFLILYKPLYKFEKKIRLMFAKTNCIIYQHLNNKLIKFFSLYKSYLKKTKLPSANSIVSNILVSKPQKLAKKVFVKPIYTNKKIQVLIKLKKKKEQKNQRIQQNQQKVKVFKSLDKSINISLANKIFKYFFKEKFEFSYLNFFKNNLLKFNWLKKQILNNTIYYKKIFNDFLMQFFIKYSLSTKLFRRYDIYDTSINYYQIVDKFILTLTTVLKTFIVKFFNLNIAPFKTDFILFIMKILKFDLLLDTIYKSKPVQLQKFYSIIFKIFDQFLNKNFNSTQFKFSLDINEKAKKRYLFGKQFNFYHDLMLSKDPYYSLLRAIQFKGFLSFCSKQKENLLRRLIRNKFSNYLLSIKDLPYLSNVNIDDNEMLYENYHNYLNYLKFKSQLGLKKKYIKKKNILLTFPELLSNKFNHNKKKFILQILFKKLKINKKKVKTKKKMKLKLMTHKLKLKFKTLNFNFYKQKKYNNLMSQKFKNNDKLFNKKMILFKNILKKKQFSARVLKFNKKNSIKQKAVESVRLKFYSLKKKKLFLKIKKTLKINQKLKNQKLKTKKLRVKKKILRLYHKCKKLNQELKFIREIRSKSFKNFLRDNVFDKNKKGWNKNKKPWSKNKKPWNKNKKVWNKNKKIWGKNKKIWNKNKKALIKNKKKQKSYKEMTLVEVKSALKKEKKKPIIKQFLRKKLNKTKIKNGLKDINYFVCLLERHNVLLVKRYYRKGPRRRDTKHALYNRIRKIKKLPLSTKKNFYQLFKALSSLPRNEKNDNLVSIGILHKKILAGRTQKKVHKFKKILKSFLTKKNLQSLTNLKFFKNKMTQRVFIKELCEKNKFNMNYIKKNRLKEYSISFFKAYKKYEKRLKLKYFSSFLKSSKFKRFKKSKKKSIINDFLKKRTPVKPKIRLSSKKKLLKVKILKKKNSLKILSFQLYTNNLQLLKKQVNKLRQLKILKKEKKLKKLNRKKILLHEISINYIKNLFQIYKNFKFKYLNVKKKIKLLNTSLSSAPLLENIKLKKKLNNFKRSLNKILKKLKKTANKFSFNFKLNKKLLKNKKSIFKKVGFKKKPYLIKQKYFKNKGFELNTRAFNRRLIYFYSKNYKQSLYGKKFRRFCKSKDFKKAINYEKHYQKFLIIKKRIKKEINFKLNYFLLERGFYQYCRLTRIQKLRRKKRKELKRKNKIKSRSKVNFKNNVKIKLKNKVKYKLTYRQQKKTLLIKYSKKLIEIDLKIFKLLKQNLFLNKFHLSLTNNSILKNNNLLKLKKLYFLKSKINKLKKIKLQKIKKLKKIKVKESKKIRKSKKLKLNKRKICKLVLAILKKKKEFFKLKQNNNNKLLKINILKLRQLKLKLKKLKLKCNKIKLKKLKLKNNNLGLTKKKKKIKIKEDEGKLKEITEKAIKNLRLIHKAADAKLLQDDLKEMKKIKDLKKQEDERFFKVNLKKNATTFDSGLSFKERQKKHIYRVQRYYRNRQKRLKADKHYRRNFRIPRTKKKIHYFSQQQKYIHKKVKQLKRFSIQKYISIFILLLKTRLNLFKNKIQKNHFHFLFLNKLKTSIKAILFKNKSSYYNIITTAFDGMTFYNEYKLWHLHFKKLKKIPFKLIRLYSKFYFNKLLYNLKIKSNFYFFYYNYLKARTKVKYFNIKQSQRSFKKKRIKRLAQIMFHKLFKFHMKFFIASKNVIFSLMRNGSFYMYYKLYEISRHKTRKNLTVSLFLTNLSKRRSFYVSKSTSYSNFFFIYWAKKNYGYKVYGNYKHSFDEFNIFRYYFKFFKSKTFFFNYLINFIFSYIQKININIFNYVFILNQYKTKLIIDSHQFYKYLILFHFKRNQYSDFFNLKESSHIVMPRYFSFFSLFFKELSIELSNWYSLVNNSRLNLYQSTVLFNLCFINHNTNAVYLHYKYKYLYYYRVYNFYIFYIFYYLYNHLFKVYKKLKLKSFKLSYDLIKYNEYNRYYLGLRTRMLILTIRNRYKRGFTVEKIFRNLKFFLRESMKKKELAGYYISIRGRYKRSSRSNKLILKKGVYSFNNIDLKVDSSYGTLNTKYGIAGIKVIFAFK